MYGVPKVELTEACRKIAISHGQLTSQMSIKTTFGYIKRLFFVLCILHPVAGFDSPFDRYLSMGGHLLTLHTDKSTQ